MSSDQRKSLGLHVLQAEDFESKFGETLSFQSITLSSPGFKNSNSHLFKNEFISEKLLVSPKKIFRLDNGHVATPGG